MTDSKFESTLDYNKLNYTFPLIFKDKNGSTFKAKPDALFKDNINNKLTFIEFKQSTPLNSKTSIRASRTSLQAQCKWRGLSATGSHSTLSGTLWSCKYYKDCLNHAWNHSKYKHAIISAALALIGVSYLVIYQTHPPSTGKAETPFKLAYAKKGLNVLLLSEFNLLVSSGRFTQIDTVPDNAFNSPKQAA